MKVLATIVALVLCTTAQAQNVVRGVRMWTAPDNTRLVFDVSAPPEHSVFSLADPDRIVIDIKKTQLAKPVQGLDFSKGLVTNIRTAMQENGDLRVVLDLKKSVHPKSFVLPPNAEYGNRLVVDLIDSSEVPAPVPTVAPPVSTQAPASPSSTVAEALPPSPVKTMGDSNGKGRDIIVAIDAGHGGDDSGAIGSGGTKEKDVVLAIALKLGELVRKEKGMRPIFTRDGDYYIGLGRRVQIAREQKADLFVSVHADSYPKNRNARGSSVFTLSPRGATSEYARLLAAKENDSDLIGGVSLEDKDNVLASVLLDLSQTATMEASSDVGNQVLAQLRRINPLHKERVEQAGFRVLKAPDLPSILVETAFISNKSEERKLRDKNEQQHFATAILQGIRSYFRSSPPPGTRLALESQRQHVIAQGDFEQYR